MAERPSAKVAAASVATLLPQGPQTGKLAMPLGRPFTLIGAAKRAHLHLISTTISRNHACIIVTDNGLYVRDLASRTGVIVNGRRVKEADLRDGDSIQLGSFQFRLGDPAGAVRLPLTPKAAPAMLDIGGSMLTPLDTRALLIGRKPTADILLKEASASNTHALIFEANGKRFIQDLGSRTGITVNGKPVNHQLIEFGDEIKIGDTTFHYVSASLAGGQVPVEEPELEEEPIGLDSSTEEPLPLLADGEDEEPPPIPVEDAAEEPITVAPGAQPSEAIKFPDQRVPAPLEVLEPVEDMDLDFATEEPARPPRVRRGGSAEPPLAI